MDLSVIIAIVGALVALTALALGAAVLFPVKEADAHDR